MSNDEDGPKPDEGKVQVGQKRKKTANTKVHISVAPKVINAKVHISVTPKAPHRKRTKKTVVVDSGDNLESSEEETCNPEEGDEVDAYERLQVQRETDRPVSSDS